MSGESKSADEMDNPMDGASGGREWERYRETKFSHPAWNPYSIFFPLLQKGWLDELINSASGAVGGAGGAHTRWSIRTLSLETQY